MKHQTIRERTEEDLVGEVLRNVHGFHGEQLEFLIEALEREAMRRVLADPRIRVPTAGGTIH